VALAETLLAGEDLLVDLDCQRADRVGTLLRSPPLPCYPYRLAGPPLRRDRGGQESPGGDRVADTVNAIGTSYARGPGVTRS
jgi:hypothetical protein